MDPLTGTSPPRNRAPAHAGAFAFLGSAVLVGVKILAAHLTGLEATISLLVRAPRAVPSGMRIVPAMVALLLLAAPARAGVTTRKSISGNIEMLRVTGLLMVKGGTAKPAAPRLSYSCTLVGGSGVCQFSVAVDGKQVTEETLHVTHDDGDLVIAGTCTVSRSAKTFEWDWEDGKNVLVLVPGS